MANSHDTMQGRVHSCPEPASIQAHSNVWFPPWVFTGALVPGCKGRGNPGSWCTARHVLGVLRLSGPAEGAAGRWESEPLLG